MRRVICCGVASILIAVLFVAGCGGEYRDEPAEPPQAAAAAKLPDPGPEEAGQVEAFVRQWVAEQSGQDGVYDIPPRAGHDVTGTLTGFHTVHQKDAETYSVCVDFQHGDDMYDVDFFVARTESGLSTGDHYLHKINGEAVE